MTTDNGAAAGAVAEPEVKDETQVLDSEQVEGGLQLDASQEESAGARTGGESEGESFDVTSLPEYQEIMGSPAEDAGTAPKKPGTSVEEVQAQARELGFKTYAEIMDEGETSYVDALVEKGWGETEAKAAWQEMRGVAKYAAENANLYVSTLWNQAVARKLEQGELKEFTSRVYSTTDDALDAFIGIGEARERKRVDEAKANKQLFTGDQMKRLTDAAFNAGRGLQGRDSASGSGGQSVDGTGGSGRGSFKTIREAEAAHVAGNISNDEIRRIRDSGLPY